MSDTRNPTTTTLEILVDRVKSTSDTFSVVTGSVSDQLLLMTAKMFTGPARTGQRWTLCGGWKEDPKWGRQFVAGFAALAVPRNDRELEAFLLSDQLPGWSWPHLSALRQAFPDEDLVTVIELNPARVATVPGITDQLLESLYAAWERGRGLAPVYVQLGEWGIGGPLCDRIVKVYGFHTVDVLTTNPYTPIAEVPYYTWKVAEHVAGHLTIAPDDPRRVTAAVTEVVRAEALEEGHTWLTHTAALGRASVLLDMDRDEIAEVLDEQEDTGTLVREGDRLYPAGLHEAEHYIASQIAQRLDRPARHAPELVDALDWLADEGLSSEQLAAVTMALTNTVSVLTGGPGVGKTRTISTLVRAAQALKMPVTLIAPTGKAAQRMAQVTGQQASTIHRALGLAPGQSHVSEVFAQLTGLVVADECSMIDTTLAAALFSGIAPTAHILLVGDPDQLPSVGPGAILRDILTADVLTRVHLTRVFRNDAGIAVNAAHIRAGEQISSLPDCRLISYKTPDDACSAVLRLLTHDLPAMGYGRDDVLVMTPTNDGQCGRHRLNTVLQSMYNSPQTGYGITRTLDTNTFELREGDRVMVTKNNTELGVFNGDTGVITAVQLPARLTVQIDDRIVTFQREELKLLQLAYAITVHKSQGSEAPVVIIPVFPSRVLDRSWTYTAITRARRQVYLIGDVAAIQGSISLTRMADRRTGLVARITEMVSAGAPTFAPCTPFAHVAGSQVCHTLRLSTPWRTSCGLSAYADDWHGVQATTYRSCLRCQATTGAAVTAFPLVSDPVDVVARAS